jgi:translation initiation factor 2D
MIPGLAGPPFPPGAKKGATVAIASTDSPSVPVAVGICEIDVSQLQQVQGAKGHAVRIGHWVGDELWAWSASGKPGGVPPESIPGWLLDDEEEIAKGVENLDIHDEDGGVAINQALKNGDPTASNGDKGLAEEVDVDDKELTTKGDSSCGYDIITLTRQSRDRRCLPECLPLRCPPSYGDEQGSFALRT